ncbi:hypothetical protein Tco_0412406 [Tanacetum coccineum]
MWSLPLRQFFGLDFEQGGCRQKDEHVKAIGSTIIDDLGETQAQKSGTDALLDLLSIGSAPPQNGSSIPDILSISQDNKTSVTLLDSPSSTMGPSLPTASTAMMDLLDGFGPSPQTTGNNVENSMYSDCSTEEESEEFACATTGNFRNFK